MNSKDRGNLCKILDDFCYHRPGSAGTALVSPVCPAKGPICEDPEHYGVSRTPPHPISSTLFPTIETLLSSLVCLMFWSIVSQVLTASSAARLQSLAQKLNQTSSDLASWCAHCGSLPWLCPYLLCLCHRLLMTSHHLSHSDTSDHFRFHCTESFFLQLDCKLLVGKELSSFSNMVTGLWRTCVPK